MDEALDVIVLEAGGQVKAFLRQDEASIKPIATQSHAPEQDPTIALWSTRTTLAMACKLLEDAAPWPITPSPGFSDRSIRPKIQKLFS